MKRTTPLSAYLALAPILFGQVPTAQQAMRSAPGGPYLGVGVIEVDQNAAQRVGLNQPGGVEVANVAQDSPAFAAGLERGDVVTKFRGEPVQGVEHFVRLVRETPVGRTVEMEVASSAGVRTAKAAIGQRQAVAQAQAPQARVLLAEPVEVDIPRSTMLVNSRSLGATLEAVGGQFAGVFGVTEGVLVREIEPGGAAASAGLTPGDVITAVDGRAVRRTSDIRMELSRAQGEKAWLQVMRNKAPRRLEIETGRKTFTQPFEGARPVSRQN